MASGNTETTIRIDPENLENGRWLSRADFMSETGVIERTLTNRIKSGYYKSRLNAEGNREIFLPSKPATENLPEVPETNAGSRAGNISGNQKTDPETTFRHDRKPQLLRPENTGNQECENCESLQGKIALLETQLKAVEVAYARLEGQMEGKDDLLEERNRVIATLQETITAKDQAINAANAAVLLYEKQNQAALDTPLDASRQIEAKPSGWKWPWQK